VGRTYPGTLTVTVKRADGNDVCSGFDPSADCSLTAGCVAEAITRGPEAFSPFQPALPMVVSVEYHREVEAAKVAERSWVERANAVSVQVTLDRRCDLGKWILDVERE
jgi:D-aminopeptidase